MPTFAGVNGFASGNISISGAAPGERGLAAGATPRGNWDFELVGTYYTYLTSNQRAPSASDPA